MRDRVYRRFAPDRRVVLFEGDCERLLPQIPDGSVDLVVTSPPYCMDREYDASNSVEVFEATHRTLLPTVWAKVKDGGSLCWQVGVHVRRNVIVPLDYIVHGIMASLPGARLRNRIIWTFGHGLHLERRFSGRYEVVLWYTKGDNHVFELDAVRVPQKYPGKRRYKGDRKGEFSGNPLGKNPTDVWDIPNVKSCHVEKTDHPCQFPVALAKRLVDALSPANGLVFDPFAGSGTTGVAAIIAGRRFVGAELHPAYAQISRNRLKLAQEGALRYRPEDQPVREPQAGEAVSRRPDHFVAPAEATARVTNLLTSASASTRRPRQVSPLKY